MGTSAQRLEKVAVVIPTRDRWPLLQVAIDCALHQQDVAVQVMVVDDGSVDSTPRELAAPGRFSDVSAAGEANDRAVVVHVAGGRFDWQRISGRTSADRMQRVRHD